MAYEKGKLWQKSETRDVRPFKSASDYLRDVAVRFLSDQEFIAEERIDQDEIDVSRLRVSVRVAQLAAEIEDAVQIPIKDLKLIISLEDPIFKMRELAYQGDLGEFTKAMEIIDLPEDIVHSMSWLGEMRLHVAVVLRESRSGEAGTAERVGSWLASKSFLVGKPKETSAFKIDSVDPEFFVARKLPRNTTYLIEIADTDLNQPCDAVAALVKVSMAKDVYTALGRDEGSPAAKAFMRAVYVDVITTVLATGYGSLQGGVDDNSILDVVTRRLAKSTGMSPAAIAKIAKDSAGASLRAVVQADAELSRSVVSAMQRKAA